MSCDALTLAALRQELTKALIGGRVQRIVRVSEIGLGLEIYTGERHQLLVSAEAQAPQVRLVRHKLRRGEEKPSPLSLLLRKYVDGARLVDITQPELERVLTFHFLGQHGQVRLTCELMGNLSNLILVDADGRIMDAAKRVSGSVNRYRQVLPRQVYVPPPPQDKLDPLNTQASELLAAMSESGGPLFRRLLQSVAGVSPLLAREVVHRATGSSDTTTGVDLALAGELVSALAGLWRLPETGDWHPGVGYGQGAEGRTPLAFAPYELTHWPDRERCETLQEAAARVLDRDAPVAQPSARASADGYERARQRLAQLVQRQIERREQRLTSMREGLVSDEELEALRLKGSAILAASWRIEPGGEEVIVTREEVTGEQGPAGDEVWRILLDPALSPAENAQMLFEAYRKRQAALERVPELIASTEQEIAALHQAETDIALAADRAQLDQVESWLREAGYLKRRSKGATATALAPLAFWSPDGMQILVGRNSRQNAEVTFHGASPDDLWLHVHGLPGSHVVIRTGGQPVSGQTLTMAAQLAAHYSAARDEASVQVDYTVRKYVRAISGAGPGMVTYRNEETLVVSAELPKLGRLEQP